jgi:EAL domain-containing protein (putative c-di-GMP-specific phosphodiesterase class I)
VDIARLSFLVAESEPVQRTLLVNILKSQGSKKVYAANDGREALDVLLKQRAAVDVIICEVHMPGMDGMQFIRAAAEADYRGSVIIVGALERSQLSSAEATATSFGINLLGVITKPVTRASLEGVLARHDAHPESKATSGGPAFTVAEIMQGLEKDEFEAFFQPKVDFATGRVVGAEALARWRHPQHGIVLPGAFVKLLEDSGKIDELTWSILSKAVAFCSAFNRAGLNTVVAVNFSVGSLSRVGFADRVFEIVEEEGLSADRICLEMSETAATSDLAASVLENLTRLRMKGFGLSVDNFGTGSSSLQQLTRIEFTELKIDRSCVSNLATNNPAMVVLKASLDIARQLKIKVVAQGVETLEDWNMLKGLGCNIAQGHFIAEAMDAEAYVAWVRSLAIEPTFYSEKSPARARLD